MVLSSIKPNFLIPLLLLMLFRRNFKAVAWGLGLCALTAGAGVAWLSYHNGVENFIASFHGGQQALHLDPAEMPVNTWTRVDLLGMAAKIADQVPSDKYYLLSMLVLSIFVGSFLWPMTQPQANTQTGKPAHRDLPSGLSEGACGLSGFIIALTVLLGLYHHSYDCLLLAAPTIACLYFGGQTLPQVPKFARVLVGLLAAVPAANYLSTKSAMDWLNLQPLSARWQAVTLINGIALTAALAILLYFAWLAASQRHARSR